jgi:membrane-associated phospholipid phosphatase
VHWLSDVLGGIAFGLFWTTLLFLGNELFDSYREERKKKLKNFKARMK